MRCCRRTVGRWKPMEIPSLEPRAVQQVFWHCLDHHPWRLRLHVQLWLHHTLRFSDRGPDALLHCLEEPLRLLYALLERSSLQRGAGRSPLSSASSIPQRLSTLLLPARAPTGRGQRLPTLLRGNPVLRLSHEGLRIRAREGVGRRHPAQFMLCSRERLGAHWWRLGAHWWRLGAQGGLTHQAISLQHTVAPPKVPQYARAQLQ